MVESGREHKMNFEFPSQLRTTLSHASPDKAAEIRSAVTGALKYSKNGMFGFERSVETTFVLPWDLDPCVEPQKLTRPVRDGIRSQLLEDSGLSHLEQCGAINNNRTVMWQYRGLQGGEWAQLDPDTSHQIEAGYLAAMNDCLLTTPTRRQYQVSYLERRIVCVLSREIFEIRRLAFAPLMPMKTEADTSSLFHAASLGFWGVHDRTNLLSSAVMHTLSDIKAQYSIYDRWSEELSRLDPSGDRPQFPQWEAAKQNIISQPQLHLFTLSNVVQRPIIVYAHPESNVGGIYLPLLWESAGRVFPCDSQTHLKNPLILGYDYTKCHFMPLVTFKGPKGPDPALVPLMNPNGSRLRVHFLDKEQASDPTALISKLMFVDQIVLSQPTSGQLPHLSSSSSSPSLLPLLVCVLNLVEMPEVIDQLVKRYQSLFL